MMLNRECSFLFHFLLLILTKNISADVEVNIKQGTLSGKQEESFFKKQTFYSFRGIPYAKPPVGDLRFKPPSEHSGWEGTLEAYTNKPTCMQFNSRMRLGEKFGISGSEDCLYLSIFTPSTDGLYPVVVFDYSDSFRTGFNGTKTYSPQFFVEEEVITVYISHRLGLFGYLTTEDDAIPPNNGLKDFILGLEWIQNNIEKFGGDLKRVTLMGNRGGAALANILLYSHKAKGLFQGVILQSGTAIEPIYFYDKPKEAAYKIAKELEIEFNDHQTLVIELQKLEAEVLIGNDYAAVDNDQITEKQISVFPLAPTIELDSSDAIITQLPEKNKIVNDVPVLLGFNSREGLDSSSHFIADPSLVMNMNQDILMHFPVRVNFRFDQNSTVFEDAVREIREHYFKLGYFDFNNILEYAVYIGDVLQNYAVDFTTHLLSQELESPVYYYMFDYRGLLNENSDFLSRGARASMENWGATITDELCYLHMCSRIKRIYKELKGLVSEPTEFKVLKKMVRLWTNFIKTGNPTPGNDDDVLKHFVWEPVERDSEEKKYLHINKKLQMLANPLGNRRKFWDDFLRKYSAMADSNGVVRDEKRDEL